MSLFAVGILGREHLGHYACFEDFARAMVGALRDLGHEVAALESADDYAAHFERGGRLIAFGAQNAREVPHAGGDAQAAMPRGMILYNSEQVSAVQSPTSLMWAHDQYRRETGRSVWDYSRANIEVLRTLGIEAVHCPVGYHSTMETVEPAADEDIDVLFYGSRDKWRNSVLNAVEDSGLRVARLFGVYGAERDRAIARAKIVLNLHFYKGGVFEIFRCSHLFANGRCVVTEGGGRDAELEGLAREAARYVPRSIEALVDACRELAGDACKRREQAERGREVFKRLPLAECVRRALEVEEAGR